MLRYSKNTRYLGINGGQISHRIGSYNSTRVIFDSELSNSGLTILASSLSDFIIKFFIIRFLFSILEPLRTGLVFVLRLIMIFGFLFDLWLNQCHRLLRFASRTNLDSVPRFAKIWSTTFKTFNVCLLLPTTTYSTPSFFFFL